MSNGGGGFKTYEEAVKFILETELYIDLDGMKNSCIPAPQERRSSFDAAALSDSEARVGRPRRRRTTGGSDVGEDIERARQLGYGSDQNGNHTSTLTRQQIVSMVKRRFGLKQEGQAKANGERKVNGVADNPPPKPPLPQVSSSPKEKKYKELLDKPGTYPTLPRKDENMHTQPVSTPGVVYLQVGDEIKRAMLPANLGNVEQVRDMFRQTFPEKLQDKANNRKTVYIKDSSCGVFYELDSVGDLTNKSHLKVLEAAPAQNGTASHSVAHTVSTPVSKRSAAPVTSTPLQSAGHVEPCETVIHSGGAGNSHVTTTIVTRRIPTKQPRGGAGTGNLMEKKKVPLHGLGTALKPTDGKWRATRDPMEEQLDSLTSMLQEALKTNSQDSLPTAHSNEGSSETSSQASSSCCADSAAEGNGGPPPLPPPSYRGARVTSDSGTESMPDAPSPLPEGKLKSPPPPPRGSSHAVSRDSSLKYSQTLQRTPQRSARQEQTSHYQTLPLSVSKTVKRTLSEGSSPAQASHATVTYGGRNQVRKRALGSRAAELKHDVLQLRAQLGELRQLQSRQAREFTGCIKAAMEQITRSVAKINAGERSSLTEGRQKVETEEMMYIRNKNDVNRRISELESEVEMVRLEVVQRRCVGNPVGVDSLNSQLVVIGRQVAELKGQFSELQENMKAVMAAELEIIVEGDKFLKQEPLQLENLVSRCKHVTGTLFTLQKLLSAQEQMKSESHSSFSSIEEVDKDMLESIRQMQREYLPKGLDNHEDPKNGKGRHRVRFLDEVTPNS